MARVTITEYRAKKLILGDAYQGISVHPDLEFPKGRPLEKGGKYVVKVDQGVKGRFKKGLLFLDQSAEDVPKALATLQKKGYSRFLIEPYTPHDEKDERYLSLERVRDGIRIMYARVGGVEIESYPEQIQTYTIYGTSDSPPYMEGVSPEFLSHVLRIFEEQYFSFLEINPLVGEIPLDAAVMVDSAAAFFVRGWGDDDIVEARQAPFGSTQGTHPAEAHIAALQKTSPASLKLTVLNPDGALWFLLSGGGGSIVVLDEVVTGGGGALIGNYGEYSGGPSREETYLYAKEVLGLLLASKGTALRRVQQVHRKQAQGKKALVIAGGVANFTDVGTTFAGIIDALKEVREEIKKQNIPIYVRRGGPHEKEGLGEMRAFLTASGIVHTVHGSEALITSAATEAVEFVRK